MCSGSGSLNRPGRVSVLIRQRGGDYDCLGQRFDYPIRPKTTCSREGCPQGIHTPIRGYRIDCWRKNFASLATGIVRQVKLSKPPANPPGKPGNIRHITRSVLPGYPALRNPRGFEKISRHARFTCNPACWLAKRCGVKNGCAVLSVLSGIRFIRVCIFHPTFFCRSPHRTRFPERTPGSCSVPNWLVGRKMWGEKWMRSPQCSVRNQIHSGLHFSPNIFLP